MVNVEAFLQENQIDYELHEHQAAFTCEAIEKYCPNIPGLSCKNLFFRNKKGNRYFLVVLPATRQADVKAISALVGENRISFASAERLMKVLGLAPGSVTPFGLLNDSDAIVNVFIDKGVYESDIVNFHPNRNTATLELKKEMFHKYLGLLKNRIEII